MVNALMDLLGQLISWGILGALATIAYQMLRIRRDRKVAIEQEIKRRRLAAISDLVAYRFVLTGKDRKTEEAVTAFNAALNRVPVEFIDFPEVIEMYRSIGAGFNSDKFHALVVALVEVTTERPNKFDSELLENVPSTTTN